LLGWAVGVRGLRKSTSGVKTRSCCEWRGATKSCPCLFGARVRPGKTGPGSIESGCYSGRMQATYDPALIKQERNRGTHRESNDDRDVYEGSGAHNIAPRVCRVSHLPGFRLSLHVNGSAGGCASLGPGAHRRVTSREGRRETFEAKTLRRCIGRGENGRQRISGAKGLVACFEILDLERLPFRTTASDHM